MSENFCPDYGVMVKELFPEVESFFFYDLLIDEICRIGPVDYSLFCNYEFAGATYALSLDFGLELMPALVDRIRESFSKSTLDAILYRLIEPEHKHKSVKLGLDVITVGCEAKLGEIEVNQNEVYIPFIVTRFF